MNASGERGANCEGIQLPRVRALLMNIADCDAELPQTKIVSTQALRWNVRSRDTLHRWDTTPDLGSNGHAQLHQWFSSRPTMQCDLIRERERPSRLNVMLQPPPEAANFDTQACADVLSMDLGVVSRQTSPVPQTGRRSELCTYFTGS